jgi:type VI secretion system protein ImpH
VASASRPVDFDVNASVAGAKLRVEPFRFEFFQAVRLMERLFPASMPVGESVPPASEVVRLGVHASLAFPASEIQEMDWAEHGPPRMTVNFMGLIGPQGVLPVFYTALVRERLRASDTALKDFLDIFHHRIISLFYRAWKKYRFDVDYERGERGRFSRKLLSLVGLGTARLQGRQAVPDDSLVYYAGLLTQRPRSAQALRQILEDYFDVPVEVAQFAGGWYRLDTDVRCCLDEGTPGRSRLGLGAVVGDAIWNQQSRIRIIIGPLDLKTYSSFLPDGSCWERLRAWVRFFSNDEFDFEVRLILKRQEVPRCELGSTGESGARLGWVSWVKSAAFGHDPDDTVLPLTAAEGGYA